jgi:alpha-ketoglutarate-dependent taurine dioxygenase
MHAEYGIFVYTIWPLFSAAPHGVLCIPGQHALPAGGLERLANYFGAPVPGPGQIAKDGKGLLPQVLRSEDSSSNSAAGWHTDLNFQREPCTVTMLHCLVAPLKSGGTQFASRSRGYDCLPTTERNDLAGLHVAHLPRPFFNASIQMDPAMTNVHPLVRPQPQTGRPALYLPPEDWYSPQSIAGWTSGTPLRRQGLADGGGLVGELLGVDATATDCAWHPPHRPDGSDLLELAGSDRLRKLMLHCVRPGNTCSHRWEEGDVVMWDNSAVLHRADILGLPGQGLRLLHRVSVKGQPVPSLPRDCDSADWLAGASATSIALNVRQALAEGCMHG